MARWLLPAALALGACSGQPPAPPVAPAQIPEPEPGFAAPPPGQVSEEPLAAPAMAPSAQPPTLAGAPPPGMASPDTAALGDGIQPPTKPGFVMVPVAPDPVPAPSPDAHLPGPLTAGTAQRSPPPGFLMLPGAPAAGQPGRQLGDTAAAQPVRQPDPDDAQRLQELKDRLAREAAGRTKASP